MSVEHEWMNKNLKNLQPKEGIKLVSKHFNMDIEGAKMMYKDWREQYIKSRVI